MSQLVEEQRSLHRIKNMYKTDAENCHDCQNFWNKLELDKIDHVRELTNLLKKHLV